MERFNFKTNLNELDERSIFANLVLKLIYQKNNGNLDKAIIEAEPYFTDFEIHIRNVYELVENEIPLYAYGRLMKYGADNFGYSDKEFTDILYKIRDACVRYYN